MRGRRLKQEAQKEAEREAARASAEGEPPALGTPEVIDVSDFTPRRRPSRKWRELIQKVWEADPLLCPTCHEPMRMDSLVSQLDRPKGTAVAVSDSPDPIGLGYRPHR